MLVLLAAMWYHSSSMTGNAERLVPRLAEPGLTSAAAESRIVGVRSAFRLMQGDCGEVRAQAVEHAVGMMTEAVK